MLSGHTRGAETSRIEAFSDGVFAFALTLLVVSLEVPRSFAELIETMRGFPAFGACFAILVWIWVEHYRFFRQYRIAGGVTASADAACSPDRAWRLRRREPRPAARVQRLAVTPGA